jgi:hypothetical protein
VIVDVGGGYGGGVTLRLKDNGIEPTSFTGATESIEKTKDDQLAFANKRAEAWWKFREALDPDQPDGSAIALPPDPELKADLCAPTWKLGVHGILLESKDGSSGFGNLRQRLGRSPGKGDAVAMAWSEGNVRSDRVNSTRNVNEDRLIGQLQFIEGHFPPIVAAHALTIDREAGFACSPGVAYRLCRSLVDITWTLGL